MLSHWNRASERYLGGPILAFNNRFSWLPHHSWWLDATPLRSPCWDRWRMLPAVRRAAPQAKGGSRQFKPSKTWILNVKNGDLSYKLIGFQLWKRWIEAGNMAISLRNKYRGLTSTKKNALVCVWSMEMGSSTRKNDGLYQHISV